MQKDVLNKFKYSISYLLAVHAGALLVFSVLRYLLFAHINYDFVPEAADSWQIKAKAFLIGLWFDNVIACYILALPLVVFWISSLLNWSSKWLFRAANIWFIAFSGEDANLRGSTFQVENPSMPLESIKYLFNLDMVGDNNPVQYCEVSDAGMADFPIFEQINAQRGYFWKLHRGNLAANSASVK